MDDFLQHFGNLGRLILKIVVVSVILRILIFALGIKIVEYIPIIDDIITLMAASLNALSNWGQSAIGSVVKM